MSSQDRIVRAPYCQIKCLEGTRMKEPASGTSPIHSGAGFRLFRKKVERDLAFLLRGFISDRRNIKPVRQS